MATPRTAGASPPPKAPTTISPRQRPYYKKSPSPNKKKSYRNYRSNNNSNSNSNNSSPNKSSSSALSASASPMALKLKENPSHRAIKPIWQTWDSFAVNLFGVPDEATAFTIWTAFNPQGNIFSIDLYEDDAGRRNGKGRIRFRFVSSLLLEV